MNLDDKCIAMDCLGASKHGVECLTKAALECSNTELRQALRRMRDQEEQSQEKLGQIAQKNNWYLASNPADHGEVRRVKDFFAGARGGSGVAAPGAGGYREERQGREAPPRI